MEEHQSIARLKQGDIGGLEELARKYYLQAVRAAYLVVQDQASAEDVVQASFINLNQKIRQFDESKDFRPWFLRSVVNNAISACRKRKRNVSLSNEDETGDVLAVLDRLAEAGPGPEEEYITQETRQTVLQALAQLTPQQRAAVVLRYYLELSEDEMTEQLNRPKSTIKWILFSARRKLRQLLRPFRSVEKQAETVLQDKERLA